MLAKKRYRSDGLLASELSSRPKFDAGDAIQFLTRSTAFHVLAPSVRLTARDATAAEMSLCASGTLLLQQLLDVQADTPSKVRPVAREGFTFLLINWCNVTV